MKHHRVYNFDERMSLVDKLFFFYREDKDLKMKFSTKLKFQPFVCMVPAAALGIIYVVCLLL